MFDSHIILSEQLNTVDICAQAKQAGLSGICFTEHIVSSEEKITSLKCKPVADLDIRHGIQIDFEYDFHENMAMKIAGYDLDYIVNNVGTLSGISLDDASLYTNYLRSDIYGAYLEKVFDSLDAAYDYSVIGAPGYVSLNSYYPFPMLTYKDFPDILNSILLNLVYSGKGIELNASAYSKIKHPIPDETILERFLELGGEIITIGSHSAPGKNVGVAYDMLKSVGYKYVTVFKHGKPEMIEI